MPPIALRPGLNPTAMALLRTPVGTGCLELGQEHNCGGACRDVLEGKGGFRGNYV